RWAPADDHPAASDLQHRRQRLARPGRGTAGPVGRPVAAQRPADARGIPHPGDRPAREHRPRPPGAADRPPRPHPAPARRPRPGAPAAPPAGGAAAALPAPPPRRASAPLPRSAPRRALRLDDEPEASRDRYGDTPFGQGVLLARRLVEAGVGLVQVNWYRGAD